MSSSTTVASLAQAVGFFAATLDIDLTTNLPDRIRSTRSKPPRNGHVHGRNYRGISGVSVDGARTFSFYIVCLCALAERDTDYPLPPSLCGASTMKDANRSMGVMMACMLLISSAIVSAQDWPQWRGPNRDGKVSDFTAPQTWPETLAQKWRTTVGSGDATPALVGDRLYVFARQDGDEVTLCLDAGSLIQTVIAPLLRLAQV